MLLFSLTIKKKILYHVILDTDYVKIKYSVVLVYFYHLQIQAYVISNMFFSTCLICLKMIKSLDTNTNLGYKYQV